MIHSTVSNFSIKRGLQTLLNVLSRFEVSDDYERWPDELWATGDMVERLGCLDKWENDPDLVSESTTTLQGLRHVGNLLTILQKSLEQVTEVLESKLLSFEFSRGISVLPDSILSDIFEFVVAECLHKHYVPSPHLDLSLVNHRFRDIVSNSPRLWRSTFRYFRPSTMELFLTKSKDVGLELTLGVESKFSWRTNPYPFLLPIALPHCGRWEDLTLNFHEDSFDDEKTEDIFQSLIPLHLSRLRNLSINYPYSYRASRHPSQHFYKTWDFSKLRSFRIKEGVPETFIAPLLTVFSVQLRVEVLDAEKLLEFLSANRALEDITFDFGCRSVGEFEALGIVVLENVKTFRMYKGRFYPFMKVLRIPNVREIELHLNEWEDTARCLELALHDGRYPHLESLTHELDSCRNKYTLPFHQMPKLRFLSLETPEMFDLESCELPPLRELRVKVALVEGWEMWLEDLHHQMVKQDKLSCLETIVIRFMEMKHPEIRIRTLIHISKLFGVSRIVWVDAYRQETDLENSEQSIRFLS